VLRFGDRRFQRPANHGPRWVRPHHPRDGAPHHRRPRPTGRRVPRLRRTPLSQRTPRSDRSASWSDSPLACRVIRIAAAPHDPARRIW